MLDFEKVVQGLYGFRREFCGDLHDWKRFDDGLALIKEQDLEIRSLKSDLAETLGELAEARKEQEDMVPIKAVSEWLAGYATPPKMLPSAPYKREDIVTLWVEFLKGMNLKA